MFLVRTYFSTPQFFLSPHDFDQWHHAQTCPTDGQTSSRVQNPRDPLADLKPAREPILHGVVGVEGGHSGGTGSSNIWLMPISQTVVMRSASDYRSLSLVHGRKSVISKFNTVEIILGVKWGTGVGFIRYVSEGYILPPEKNFPSLPVKICDAFANYGKIAPQQWSCLWARAPTPLSFTPEILSGVH